MGLRHTFCGRRGWVLVVLFLLGLGVRGFRAWQEPVVNPDAIRFIDQAQRFATDPLGALRSEPYHPLHSLAGLVVHACVRRLFSDDRAAWLAAMQLVGIIAGAFVAVQIVWLARAIGARFWWAAAAGLVWIVGRRTSAYGADGISDMLFLALFAGAMLAGIRALRFRAGKRPDRRELRKRLQNQMLCFFAAGLLAGLAYLTRPEGLGVAIILTGAVLSMTLRWRGRNRRFKSLRRRSIGGGAALAAIGCLLAGVAIPAVPYMAVIHGITEKKALLPEAAPATALPAAAVNAPPPVAARPVILAPQTTPGPATSAPAAIAPWEKVAMELWETFGFAPALILLLALPLAPRLWGRARLRMLVILWVALWIGVMFWLLRDAGYRAGRHTLPLDLVLFAWLALAFRFWGRPMRWWMGWYRRSGKWDRLPAWRRWNGWPAAVSTVVVGLAILPGAIELSVPPMADQAFIRKAAAWVAAHTPAGPKATMVCDRDRLVGYYSGRPYADWETSPGDPHLEVPEFYEMQGYRHVILAHLYLPGRGEAVPDAIGPYREVARFESATAEGHDVMVLYARARPSR